uniref:TIL domain-containing protein n=1 Tax=Tetranychus urticae TaxID=32264 RepID=T1L6M3_TETUR
MYIIDINSLHWLEQYKNFSPHNDITPRTATKVWNPCGTNCPLTGANPKPRACIKSCKADYFCPSGYLENSIGQCVIEEDCDLQRIPIDNTPTVLNYTDIPNNFSQFPESNDFQSFEPAVVRTSGSNFPYISMSAMVPKSKPLIDLDPTVPRPVLRISKEQ